LRLLKLYHKVNEIEHTAKIPAFWRYGAVLNGTRQGTEYARVSQSITYCTVRASQHTHTLNNIY